MAIRKIDSFDLYATGNLTEGPFTSKIEASGIASVNAGSGRRGTKSLRITNTKAFINRCTVRKAFDAQATWIVGFAFKPGNVASIGHDILSLRDVSTLQCDLGVDTNGKLVVSRNGTTLGTSSIAITSGVYNYIELKITISNTVGVVQLRVNGVTEINLSNQDTQNSGNASADQVWFGFDRVQPDGVVSFSDDYDDVYILDGTGGAPYNDFLGDSRVDALYPVSDQLAQWVPSTGTDHWALVDESPPNTTDYVTESTVGDIDRFGFTDLPVLTSPVVRAVQVAMYAQNPEGGARNIAATALSNAVVLDGATQALSLTFRYLYEIYTKNPDGTIDWTPTTVDAASFGAKVMA